MRAAQSATDGPRLVLGQASLLTERFRAFRRAPWWFVWLIGLLAIAATLVGALGFTAVMNRT